jgi:hypothetical protein
MKRIITMLLIACSAISTISAQKKIYPNTPQNVITQLERMINLYGQNEGQTYSVVKNPNTNIIESKERIEPIAATVVGKGPYLYNISRAFKADEQFSYQFLHIQPGNNQPFSIQVVTRDKSTSKYIPIRTKASQEMWFMACKNPENPELRDVYAAVWDVDYNGRQPMETGSYPLKGTIYMITSLRPDIYEKKMEGSKTLFKIEGRVDANIKDSLYNIYIADSYDALNAVGDDDYVACIPVINKRFEYQTELDHPKVGRLRCIFPDGKLCTDWIDLDFVPGETYRITVHNGWYDEDQDYERRVGRRSGKSLINNVKVINKVEFRDNPSAPDYGAKAIPVSPQDPATVSPQYPATYTPQPSSNWEPTAEQQAILKPKVELLHMNLDQIVKTFGTLENEHSLQRLNMTFDQIMKKNKQVDQQWQDLIKTVKSLNIPKLAEMKALSELYTDLILKFYTTQNQGFTEFYKQRGSMPQSGQKAQKYVSDLTEKYMKEMNKIMK